MNNLWGKLPHSAKYSLIIPIYYLGFVLYARQVFIPNL